MAVGALIPYKQRPYLGVQAEELTVAPCAMEAGREGLRTGGTNLLLGARPSQGIHPWGRRVLRVGAGGGSPVLTPREP